ncbi:MAG: outer membrane beta-barrel protein [Gammaproteobacteria bacterium]|nr:outer membrane beta-barrel protein [Gammaproteobacteria bacterium]
MLDVARSGKKASMSLGAREYRLVLSRFVAMVSIAVSACLPATGATVKWYVGVGIGGNASRDVVMESRSNDRASICDEYINPRALSVAGCTIPDRGAGDGWLAPFDPGAGFSGEAEFGLHLSPRWRLAAVYARSETDFDQTVSSTDATGEDFDKISNELSVGQETLGSTTSDEFRIVAYRDWPNRTRWTPYAGAGVAVSRTRKDFAWHWARSADPTDIATGLGQPNAEEIRRNLADTVSVGRRTLRDTMFGYVLVAGVERTLSESVSVGLKAQWKRFGAFESDGYAGDLLRSHPPNLRLDGSEPVSAWSRTRDTGRFSALFTIRYAMP